MANAIDFYKGLFLHVIPVRIIVPRVHQSIHQMFQIIKDNHFHGVKEKYFEQVLPISDFPSA